MEGIVDGVRQDVIRLLNGGVDGILFCNEDGRPYSPKAGLEAVAVMARVITELRPRDIPFGVDFLWDARAPLAVAKATGAGFVREVVTGVYESDMGPWAPDPKAHGRYRELFTINRGLYESLKEKFPILHRAIREEA